jgi:hypothetical protein
MRIIIELDNAQNQPMVQVQDQVTSDQSVQASSGKHIDAGSQKMHDSGNTTLSFQESTLMEGVQGGAGIPKDIGCAPNL